MLAIGAHYVHRMIVSSSGAVGRPLVSLSMKARPFSKTHTHTAERHINKTNRPRFAANRLSDNMDSSASSRIRLNEKQRPAGVSLRIATSYKTITRQCENDSITSGLCLSAPFRLCRMSPRYYRAAFLELRMLTLSCARCLWSFFFLFTIELNII